MSDQNYLESPPQPQTGNSDAGQNTGDTENDRSNHLASDSRRGTSDEPTYRDHLDHLDHQGQDLQSQLEINQQDQSLGQNYSKKNSHDDVSDPHLGPLNNAIEDPSMDKITFTDENLDQEIQRAIAQHDLQQQRLQQSDAAVSSTMLDQGHHSDKDGIGSIERAHFTQGNDQMDPADEKRHLQMIADELKRATSSEKLDGLHDRVPTSGNSDIRLYEHSHNQFENLPHQSFDQSSAFDPTQSSVTDSFPSSQAHLSTDHTIPSNVPLARAAHIPADLELLATNTALAAYNALSSHVPPVALLASVHLAALPLPIVAPDYLPARIQLLIATLPVLDNLASQLLRYFAVGPYQKIIDLASNPETAQGAAFRDLASLFEVTKRLYSEEDPFLTVEHLAPGMWKEGDKTLSVFRSREQTIESTLRKVNLATFLAATLGLLEAGFFHLNEAFLSVFCPLNNLDPANSMSNMSPTNMNPQSSVNTVIGDKVGKIFKPQATLYLDLKTQAFISGLVAGERSRQDILEDVFPTNLEEVLLKRRGVKTLSPIEIDFVNRCHSRKESLLKSEEDNFAEQYEWFGFLKDLFDLVCKDMSLLIWGKKLKPASSRFDRSVASHRVSSHIDSSLTPHSDETLQNLGGHSLLQTGSNIPGAPGRSSDSAGGQNAVDLSASQEIKDITAGLLPSEIQEQQIHLRINPSMSGRVLSRRPWTREEEKALRYALELKGPHWSTILELFGQGGQINESLKNRTQVQLKDKARNWKMFFLKSRLPVPEYLKKVTGDLERDDKLKAKSARSKKTAAAPVPAVSKRDNPVDGDFDPTDAKRHKI